MSLDAIQLAVIQNGLRQVASEMDLVHEKTSFSPVISEGYDRSNGIYHLTTGEVIAQANSACRASWASLQFSTQAVIRARPDLRQGDVVLMNDPYLGGTHLMDVKMVTPVSTTAANPGVGCRIPGTGRTPAAWCRADSPARLPKSSRKDCVSRQSNWCARGLWTTTSWPW